MTRTSTLAPERPSYVLGRKLVGELEGTFGPRLPNDQLARSVEQALRDLRGSVAPEALPEMALRLARHRLLAEIEDSLTATPAATPIEERFAPGRIAGRHAISCAERRLR